MLAYGQPTLPAHALKLPPSPPAAVTPGHPQSYGHVCSVAAPGTGVNGP